MRLTIFLIMLSSLSIFASNLFSQTVSIKIENVALKEVLSKLEDKCGCNFMYSEKFIDVNRKVSLNVDNKNLDDVLSILFSGCDIKFERKDRIIILKNAEGTNESQTSQQNRNISGKVTDSSRAPLPGVSVVIKGTTTGTITDANGIYTLGNVPNNAVLQFSFVGMKSKEIPVGSKTTIDILMEEETVGLDEVVAIGYGTQKKATLTGSVAVVKGDKLMVAPSLNFSNSLSGQLSGLVSVTRSGEPGKDGATLRIRGSNTLGDNSPLIVIDGIANRAMDRLNPADIESVTVLKDASAAIYGAQAANGVILITTKRGEQGNLRVNININNGWSSPTKIPKMADAATYATQINEIYFYRGQGPRYTPEEIQKYRDGSDPWLYPNTDWFGEVFKDSSPQRYADISLKGGSETFKYFVSAGTNYQDGIYKESATYYKQTDFRSNFDAAISQNIRLSVDLSGRQEFRNYSSISSGLMYFQLMRSYPNSPAYWPNGLPGPDIERGENPVVIATDQTGYNRSKTYVLESNIKLNVDLPWIKGLSLTGNVSFDKDILNQKTWQKPWYLYTWDGTTFDPQNQPVLIKGKRGPADPNLTQYMSDGGKTTINGLIAYERIFNNKHNTKLLFGAERLTGESMNFSAYRRYFVSSVVDQLFAGGDMEKNNNGSASEFARLNYFGRLNYNYLSKYLFEFVWRVDGSYKFPKAKRYGFFPGISLGWTVSEENFWKTKFDIINFFKLRASWGQTGNDRIADYQYLASYGLTGTTVFNEKDENSDIGELRIPNPLVTWERANQSDIGFEGQMFNGNLTFSGDYFYNLRTDILWKRNASIPSLTGLSLPSENIGKVENKGFEFQIGYNNKIGKLNYSVSVNGSFQKNKIIFWDETPGIPDYQKSTGYPMNSGLYYKAKGIFKDQASVDSYPHWAGARPGDIIFEDVNKDGKIDGLDKVRIYKNDLPTFTGGLNINLTYKNFYSTILFQGATGAQRSNFIEFTGLVGNGLADEWDGRWTPDNINATKPRARDQVNEYWASQSNTYWLRSTDYLRLKNVEIGYNVPGSQYKRLGITDLRIYLSGQNILTMTKLTDFDPESNNTGYPLNKIFNVGVAITF